MPSKYQEFLPKSWSCLRKYRKEFFGKDLIAGITVGIVALPLAMAFAVASGLPPERGIFTGIIAGFLAALFGGTKNQIAGPTGAFVVVIYNIVEKHGYEGLAMATLMAAVLLIAMGFCRFGSLIKFVPYPLIAGFTAGIAIIIFSSQINDLLGLHLEHVPASFIEKWKIYASKLTQFDRMTAATAGITVALSLFLRRFLPKVPWGIASIILVGLGCWLLDLPVETVSSRFGETPRTLPSPTFGFAFDKWRVLIPDAVTIALLAGIESLLSAVIADGMTGGRHKPNSELIGQGIANLGSVLFGGIPATAAISRTATNIKTGAKTPLAGMIHALTLLIIILFCAPLVGKIPLASLATVLVLVSWNMCEFPKLIRLLRAPKGDVILLSLTLALTVLIDITVAVEVGVIFAAFLFLKQMAEEKQAIYIKHREGETHTYEIKGPLFFGIAGRLKDLYYTSGPTPKNLKLRMKHVPSLDATGIHALQDFQAHCVRQKTKLSLVDVQPSAAELLSRFGLDSIIE